MTKKVKLTLPFPYFLCMLGTKSVIFKEETAAHEAKKSRENTQD